MQKQIRRRSQVYGVTGVLSAIILVAMIYSFGTEPMPFQADFSPEVSPMATFESYEDLKNFIVSNSQKDYSSSKYWGGNLDAQLFAEEARTSTSDSISAPTPQPASGEEYSTTNIQVEGVDEADLVKTDGSHIYLVPHVSKDRVFIVKAYPPKDAMVISEISFEDSLLAGLFLSQDSTRLAVIGSEYESDIYSAPMQYAPEIGYFYGNVKTFIKIFDISNKTTPALTREFTTSGSYFNSRMIDNYIYTVVSQPASVINDTVTLPLVYQKDRSSEIEAKEIFYSDVTDDYYTFTTYIGLNILESEQEPTNMTVMTGGTSSMYVSANNIYVTYWARDGTEIHRIQIDEGKLSFQAKGKVPGYVLNQFSMDEHGENFRIATHIDLWVNSEKSNNLYILDMNLGIVGKLENLAEGEDLHSARFMGEKCYLVTFETVDPLFVIDLSQPENPKVLGELKIPGYSDYLHPYDENHLIGVGKETTETGKSPWPLYQGVKLSLFDVSNVNEPKQLDVYVIGDRGTDSPILWDHKAFLFDKQQNLLVIPVTVYSDSYGSYIFQGAYVFDMTISNGFTLRGKITHVEANVYDSDYWIIRSLYIDNILYTISNHKIALNDLEDLSSVVEIDLD